MQRLPQAQSWLTLRGAGASNDASQGSGPPSTGRGGLRGMLGSVGSAVLPGFWGSGGSSAAAATAAPSKVGPLG